MYMQIPQEQAWLAKSNLMQQITTILQLSRFKQAVALTDCYKIGFVVFTVKVLNFVDGLLCEVKVPHDSFGRAL